ncbi:MAG: DUF6502 family protein [Thiolinea sp.]
MRCFLKKDYYFFIFGLIIPKMNKPIHRVIYRILKPLIAILHRKSIAFEEFSQIARKIYVEVAEEKLREAGERPSNSRMSVTTGLTRREVAQLRKLSHEDLLFDVHVNRGLRVINGWMTDQEFVAKDGQPATLPLQGEQGSFEALVQRYSGDVPHKAMLKELQLNGVISMEPKNTVTLLNDAYIPKKSEEERLALMGQDISELIKTIDHNHQNAPEQAYYQRKVCYDNLPLEAVEQFRAMARTESQNLLIKLNSWLVKHDRDSNPGASGTGRLRAGVGIHYFEESMIEQSTGQDDLK